MSDDEKWVHIAAIVGSHAYGLNTPESDIDVLGVFQVSTEEFLGLHKPTDTITSTDPDTTFHELGKFCRLAMKANPTVLELLWLPEENYTVLSQTGRDLITLRNMFLSNSVRDSFGGYAFDQARRLKERGDGSFSSDTRNRTAKHARHCFRLLCQGAELLRTGCMTVRVANPAELWELGELPPDEIVKRFEDEFARFKEVESVLPDYPNEESIEEFLIDRRLEPVVGHYVTQVENAKDALRTMFRMVGSNPSQLGAKTLLESGLEGRA